MRDDYDEIKKPSIPVPEWHDTTYVYENEVPMTPVVCDPNPKTLVGNSKPSITAIPGPALVHCALAMMNGVTKYGKYNWREKDVPAATYVDAAYRHLLSWNDGEEYADDSGVHHLAHTMACCAILLDAIEGGHLIDDRGIAGNTAKVLERERQRIPGLQLKWKAALNGKVR